MDEVRVIEIKRSVFSNNDKQANKVREQLKQQRTFLLNVMSSPGSGKTSLILQTIKSLRHDFKVGVMEADIDSAVDAERIAAVGIPAIQLHTGGMCHLDAEMTRQGLKEMNLTELDIIILENVGNLVCPAEFDTGAVKNVMILSVPEGDDKPLKYPLMFSTCDVLLVNKIDYLKIANFDMTAVKERALHINPNMVIFEVSAKTGEGINLWSEWLRNAVCDWIAE
jgi:hydrogenase nickel incorporation protein HypB